MESIMLQAWLVKNNDGKKMVTTNKSLLFGVNEEDFEEVTLFVDENTLRESMDTLVND